ncbi:MAG: carbohydrate ABC transporter permease [Actinobacteria bacterium]|nr:carbohydrate ABC transporter permease [Actinomycetota bacterium]
MRINKEGNRIVRIIIFIVLLMIAVSFLYPLIFMLINSLKSRPDYLKSPFSLPTKLELNNYITMVSQFKIFNLLKNSMIISIGTIVFILLFGIFASFAFAKLRFKGSNVIYFIIVSTMFIPVQVTIIPIYLLYSKVHLVNTHWSVIITYLGMFLPEALLLMVATFRGIPDEMIEAAELDGAGYFDIVRYIIIPMGRTAIILVIIFYFIVTWNDLFTPLILLTDMKTRTVMVGLATLMARFIEDPAIMPLIIYFWKIK